MPERRLRCRAARVPCYVVTAKESNRIIDERLANSRRLSEEMERSADKVVRALRGAARSVRAARARNGNGGSAGR
jgi:hypothetical protein